MMKKFIPLFLIVLLVSFMFLVSCTNPPANGEKIATVSSIETAVAVSTTNDSQTHSGQATTISPTSQPTPLPSTELFSDAETQALLQALSGNSEKDAQEALDRVLATGDQRFTAIFIELFRFRQLGIVQNLDFDSYIYAIQQLNDDSSGEDWFELIEWYGKTNLTPPSGFTGWKGQMLTQIDPGFGDFLQDDFSSTIRVEEIQWGGVRVDGIPALDNPAMLTAVNATYLDPADAVFGLSINGESRAYPLRIIDWHEMANDVVGGVPVSITYCTLCGAAVAFDGRASNGETYDFGSSGFLFRSNKLMYDRQTRTLWNQLTGEPVLGELVDDEVTLDVLPIVLTTWEAWQAQHPDTLVVDEDTGFPRNYSTGAAYADYFSYDDTMFPVWQRADVLETKAQIYAIRINSVPKAYPIELVIAEQVVNDVLGETAVVLISGGEQIEIVGTSQRSGDPKQYSPGSEIRAYDRGQHTFSPGADPLTVLDEKGQVWQLTEDALISPTGETSPRLGGHLAYWFGWYAFFPKTLIYGN